MVAGLTVSLSTMILYGVAAEKMMPELIPALINAYGAGIVLALIYFLFLSLYFILPDMVFNRRCQLI